MNKGDEYIRSFCSTRSVLLFADGHILMDVKVVMNLIAVLKNCHSYAVEESFLEKFVLNTAAKYSKDYPAMPISIGSWLCHDAGF